MNLDTEKKGFAETDPSALHDPRAVAEADLWFLPGPAPDRASSGSPLPVARREASLDPAIWRAAEASLYRGLVCAAQAATRFAERMRTAPVGAVDRIALQSVVAVMRDEGVWLNPEQIALYLVLRLGAEEPTKGLARASWALRRLQGQAAGPLKGLPEFLGRHPVSAPICVPGDERPVGPVLNALSENWCGRVERLGEVHPLTRAAYGFALWRVEAITPWDDLLEPTVAAMLIGAQDGAPVLAIAPGHRLDRHGPSPGAGSAAGRLATFYAAVLAGALSACLELDRLSAWQARARTAIAGLSGRTPPCVIDALLRFPVLSAELVAARAGCSRPTARRNLNLLGDLGLIREVTGQDRYRFWTIAA